MKLVIIIILVTILETTPTPFLIFMPLITMSFAWWAAWRGQPILIKYYTLLVYIKILRSLWLTTALVILIFLVSLFTLNFYFFFLLSRQYLGYYLFSKLLSYLMEISNFFAEFIFTKLCFRFQYYAFQYFVILLDHNFSKIY